MFLIKQGYNLYVQDNIHLLKRINPERKQENLPEAACQDNHEDPLVYLLALVTGYFDSWKTDADGEYTPHHI